MLSPQEKYDRVVRFLVAQGRPAMQVLSNGLAPQCVYRAKDGAQCAAGCLVPDELVPELNDGSWGHQKMQLQLKIGDRDLVRALQVAHDTSTRAHASNTSWRKHWVMSMSDIADSFCLSDALLIELATPEWRAGG